MIGITVSSGIIQFIILAMTMWPCPCFPVFPNKAKVMYEILLFVHRQSCVECTGSRGQHSMRSEKLSRQVQCLHTGKYYFKQMCVGYVCLSMWNCFTCQQIFNIPLSLCPAGAGESGKSTIVKQMRILHVNGFNAE